MWDMGICHVGDPVWCGMRDILKYHWDVGTLWECRGVAFGMGGGGGGHFRSWKGTCWGHGAVTPQVTVVSDGDEVGAARARGDVEKADVVDGESRPQSCGAGGGSLTPNLWGCHPLGL